MAKQSICIIGPGVVGQAQGKVFVKQGYKTAFLGGNEEKTFKLHQLGYTAYRRDELFDGTYDFDVSMFTVSTPIVNGKIDLKPIKSASIDLGKRLARQAKKYHLAVVKSTVPPGTTENVVIPLLEKYSGKKVGRDFGVCMNPEYLREKTAYQDTLNPWIIVIGEYDKKSGDTLSLVYTKFQCPLFRCSIKEAEMQKYVHNLFNAVKITFFNEMRQIGRAIGADTEKVFKLVALGCEGMWNPDYGTRNFGPFQGSCLPKDTQAFLEWAKRNHFEIPLIKSVIKTNNMLMTGVGLTEKQIGAQL